MSNQPAKSLSLVPPRPRVLWRNGQFVVLKDGEAPLPGEVDEFARLDSQVRASVATVAALAQQVEGLTARLSDAIELVELAARSHAVFANDIERLSKVLMLPTVPVYDKKGVLIGARRVESLEG